MKLQISSVTARKQHICFELFFWNCNLHLSFLLTHYIIFKFSNLQPLTFLDLHFLLLEIHYRHTLIMNSAYIFVLFVVLFCYGFGCCLLWLFRLAVVCVAVFVSVFSCHFILLHSFCACSLYGALVQSSGVCGSESLNMLYESPRR